MSTVVASAVVTSAAASAACAAARGGCSWRVSPGLSLRSGRPTVRLQKPLTGGRTQRTTCIRAHVGTAQPGEKALTESDVKLSNFTLYDVLGIAADVGLPEVKRAYREKARQYHPDANPAHEKDECTRKFLEVQQAYDILGDPELRADYDEALRNPLSLQALKLGMSARKGRVRASSTGRASKSSEEWRFQWGGQLDGLKMNMRRKKPGSWAENMQKKQSDTAKSKCFT